ncbi:MAG: AAA family ATPase [Blastomonas sp.]|uniref:AAA family ATPase n=1 Tax=Blastomonas sp. TaxID=1909299 RepID=UPI00258F3A0C|nr:AAA family ATPase [Blastomonas sp.]MCO5792681.1 AAA family ATPase [Blastomonas sp.]
MIDFVAPARAEGRASVTIVAREIHDRLGLSAAHANVCQALGGRKFQQLAGVAPPKIEGPMASSTTTFTYEFQQAFVDDNELLKIFDSCEYFRTRRVAWSDEQTSNFCIMARAVHDLGLDWYRTNIPQIRFGRKDSKANRALATLASFDAAPARIRFSHSSPELGLKGAFECDETGRAAFIKLLDAERIKISNWRPPVPSREGHWPRYNDSPEMSSAEHGTGPTSTAKSGPRYWIEKTLVSGREDRLDGDHALGKALWSPQKSKDGRQIYGSMKEVAEGDIIFHLTDNKAITDVSLVAAPADDSFTGVDGTEWADQAGYRIPLRDHEKLDPPFPRSEFLATEPFRSELKELVEGGARGLFFSRKLELNQGSYLTEGTPSLLSILNRAYQAFAGKNLPHVDHLPAGKVVNQLPPYTLDDALETLFLEREQADDIMLLWRAKKNIILQGPPGVGKSYAAQRLAYALMGMKDRDRLRFVQFHQSYSYEDFVEGFRPTETGFALKPGKFVEFCRRAESDPQRPYVFVIDEINRGNLSKILGELMVLIEPDKRNAEWSMPLASGQAPFFVPSNVYLLGLMNTADRSLAVVDYALRRRFGFVDVRANLTSPKFRKELAGAGVSNSLITMVIERVSKLNADIVGDLANLGPGFAIGHSFFCGGPNADEDEVDWYGRIIRTEIAPLLREYWFDAPDKAEQWTSQLLASS